jgi:two-component system phosphate regulon sensor histidine kinase PhoR
MIWLRALFPAALALAVGALLAWLFSDTTAARWLALALAVHALIQAWHVVSLHHWSGLPRQRDLPTGLLVWRSLLDRLGWFARAETEARGALTHELALIRASVDRLPDGLAVIDRFDHVDWYNRAAAELHGFFGTGRPVHHFIRQPEFVDYLDRSDYSNPPVIALPSRPGRLFEVRLHRTEDGGKLLLTRDVTAHARVDAMRRDFVANVSHEIRTPVTVVGGFAETLLTLELDEATRREYLTTILRQSQTMQRLVDDLLTLSSLENDVLPPAEAPMDLAASVQAVVEEARSLSQGRHTFSVDLQGPTRVLASTHELEGAIRNLLTNAVRYTPEGGRIAVHWRIEGGEGCLTVRDSGIGIAAEHLPRLTERFYRVDRGRSRDSGGTGLGLAIVKHVMQHHGGELQVESRLGEGSAFTLRLPARRLIAPATPQTA